MVLSFNSYKFDLISITTAGTCTINAISNTTSNLSYTYTGTMLTALTVGIP